MKNLWEIPGYEDCVNYLVTEAGEIYSNKTQKILSVFKDKKGYYYSIL